MQNNYKVPEVFVKAIEQEPRQVVPGRYSVTEILNPSYIVRLSRKHQPEEDVRDKVAALIGTAFHKYMEQYSNNPEVKLECNFDDKHVLSGIIDDFNEDSHEIVDYKTVNVNKVQKKDFKDNELQVYIYAYMALKKGVLITKGKLYYLMKDWKKIMTTRQEDYPLSPIYTHEFDITNDDILEAEKYVKDKLNDIEHGYEMCSEEERWYTGDDYAVYKKAGDRKAAKVCKTEEEAHQYISEKCDGTGEIQVRKGQYLRCDLYCPVRSFCERYRDK